MEYRRLGSSGLKVSEIGLGCNNFGDRCDEKSSSLVLDQALELGINFFDTADNYTHGRSEEIIGGWLKGKRDKVIVATKFGMVMGEGPNETGASRHHVMESVHNSLRRLGTDYIDLYQVHRPDPGTPVEETLRALDDLIRAGKVRYIGTSTFSALQLSEALWTSRYFNLNRFVSEQPHYNLLKRDAEKEVIPYCQANGVGIIPYYPLASGFLTGKYRPGEPPPKGTRLDLTAMYRPLLSEENFRILSRLSAFAGERGHSVGELAIAWLLAYPAVCTVIAGATMPDQVAENVKAAGWKLRPKDAKALDEIAPVKE